MRGHLRTCDECRRVAGDEAALRDGLRALPTVDPPNRMWSGIQARLAVTLHAVMMGSFVLFVHLPRVMHGPEKHEEWIMLAVSSALTGAALLIRKYAT